MSLSFHLHFNGQCQDAFEYYERLSIGTIGTMLTYSNSPMKNSVPSNWSNKVVHANINVNGGEISGSDVQLKEYEPPKGFNVLFSTNDELKVKPIFEGLSINGTILLPLQKTFWSPCYGIVIDQYGIPWKINLIA